MRTKEDINCPRCSETESKTGIFDIIKAGKTKGGEQKYKCKNCNYTFSVQKRGKVLDNYYKVKAIQLYLEGLPFYKIADIISVDSETISKYVNPIKQYLDKIKLQTSDHVFRKIKHDSDTLTSRLKERENVGIILIGEKGKGFPHSKDSLILLNKL